MPAKCSQCGKIWQISIKQDKHNYICPTCATRNRYIKLGIIKEGKPCKNSLLS